MEGQTSDVRVKAVGSPCRAGSRARAGCPGFPQPARFRRLALFANRLISRPAQAENARNYFENASKYSSAQLKQM